VIEFIDTLKAPGVLEVVGLTDNQLPPETVEAEALNGTPVLGTSLVIEMDCAAGGVPPVSKANDSACGFADRMGPLATVRVTDIVRGFSVAPVMVTVPEY